MRGTARDRLAVGFSAAALLLFCAGTIWAASIVAAVTTNCPQIGRAVRGGLDKGLSIWPTGANCQAPGRGSGTYVYEPQPWMRPAVIALLMCAALALLLALAAALRDLARSPVQRTIHSDR